MKKPKILGIIPARGGSKTLPRKNIKLLLGKPLLSYMLKAAQESKHLSRVVVSSEDDEILDIAKKHGGKDVVLRRPKELAEDLTPDIPVLQHAVEAIEKKDNITFDYVVLLHATTPLTDAEDIDAVLKKLVSNTSLDSVVSVYEVNDFHPMKMKKIENDLLFPYTEGLEEKTTSPRQGYIPVYKRNVAIYASKRDVIMKLGRVWGEKVSPYLMPPEKSIDINNELDFLLAELIMKRNLSKKKTNEKK